MLTSRLLPTDTRSLLRELADYDQMARWPSPAYVEKQASSYDRKSIRPNQPGWFANADASQYIRTEQTQGRNENVMLDADGPGAIVRFWLTTFKRHGNLRIYVDNQDTPILTIPAGPCPTTMKQPSKSSTKATTPKAPK